MLIVISSMAYNLTIDPLLVIQSPGTRPKINLTIYLYTKNQESI